MPEDISAENIVENNNKDEDKSPKTLNDKKNKTFYNTPWSQGGLQARFN